LFLIFVIAHKKMAAKALEPLFAELDDFIKDGDWGQALTASEKSTSYHRPIRSETPIGSLIHHLICVK
jgi:hypothetical protein